MSLQPALLGSLAQSVSPARTPINAWPATSAPGPHSIVLNRRRPGYRAAMPQRCHGPPLPPRRPPTRTPSFHRLRFAQGVTARLVEPGLQPALLRFTACDGDRASPRRSGIFSCQRERPLHRRKLSTRGRWSAGFRCPGSVAIPGDPTSRAVTDRSLRPSRSRWGVSAPAAHERTVDRLAAAMPEPWRAASSWRAWPTRGAPPSRRAAS